MTTLVRHLLRRCPTSASMSTVFLHRFLYIDHRESDLAKEFPTPMDLFVDGLRIGRKSFKRKSEDDECDRIVCDSLEKKDLTGALSLLKQFAASGRFPRRSRTLLIVACISSSMGDVNGVRLARNLCRSAFPVELNRLLGYRQYEAEAMWKKGDHVKALDLFLELIKEHPMHRRKLINLSCFCLRDIVKKDRLLSELRDVVLDFVQRTKDLSWVPAANLWRVGFCSDSYEAQCFAKTLLDIHGRPLHESIASKIPSIVAKAQTDHRPDVLLRLMQTLLALDMEQSYVQVMDAYVQHLCDLEDVRGAKEALRFMNRTSIFIKGETARRLVSMLINHGTVPRPAKPKVTK